MVPPTRLPHVPTFANEAAFQAAVVQLAQTLRCLCYHTFDSRRSEAGFPDLVIVGRRGFLVRELKMPGKQATKAQEMWLARFALVGVNAAVWRPEDFPTRVLSELQAIR